MHTTSDSSENLDFLVTRVGLAENLPVFSRFRLKRILGKGGMGVVWLAQDEKANREVALKFMPDIVAGNASALQDMRRETRNGIKLSHQNVVTMYDLVEENESAAIIMEYVKGSNLDIMRRNQPSQVFEAASVESYVNQLLDALDYAHNVAKMVHRDLKPANLMVDANDVLKVADFGIARNLKDTVSRISMKLNGAGTLSYMSPQQMMGDNPTSMDDIYALGATIYELLTGKPPFHTGDIATQVESRVPPRMSERRQEFGIRGAAIPEAWETVVAACLEKRPEDRPADIEAIQQGLRGQKFKRLSGQTTTRRTAQSKKSSDAPAADGLSITKLAIAAALVIGAAGYFLGGREKREPTKTATLSSKAKSTEDELLKTSRENMEAFKKTTAADFGSAWEYRMVWTEVLKKIRNLAVPGDPAWQELIDDATRLESQAKSEELREEAAYKARLNTLNEAITAAKTQSARQDLNDEGKAKVWQNFLTQMEGMSLNEDYGRGHEVLQQEALVAFNRYQSQSLTGNSASLASGADVLTSDEMRSWSMGEKEVVIKRVQQNLQQKGLYQGSLDGKHGLKLHEALIAYQKQEQMPTTARIDDSVLTRLNVDKTRPPQQVVVSRNVGGGGGSSGSRPSGGASSGVPEQIMRWSGAMGAIGNARSAWGR
jgi:serine/threonine protein kinase